MINFDPEVGHNLSGYRTFEKVAYTEENQKRMKSLLVEKVRNASRVQGPVTRMYLYAHVGYLYCEAFYGK